MSTASPQQKDTKTRHPKTTFFVGLIVVLAAIIGWLLLKPPEKVVEGESLFEGAEAIVPQRDWRARRCTSSPSSIGTGRACIALCKFEVLSVAREDSERDWI